MKLEQKRSEQNPERFSIKRITESEKSGKRNCTEMSSGDLAEAFLIACQEDDEITQRKVADEIFETI